MACTSRIVPVELYLDLDLDLDPHITMGSVHFGLWHVN
jgi:hypothetical protein